MYKICTKWYIMYECIIPVHINITCGYMSTHLYIARTMAIQYMRAQNKGNLQAFINDV